GAFKVSEGYPAGHDGGPSKERVRRTAAVEWGKNARQALIRCDGRTLTEGAGKALSWPMVRPFDSRRALLRIPRRSRSSASARTEPSSRYCAKIVDRKSVV